MSELNNGSSDQEIQIAARLFFLALNASHAESSEYQELFIQYKRNPNVENIINSIAKEFEIEILKVTDQGIFLNPIPKSLFATRSKDIYIAKKTEDKCIFGLILLGITAYTFPNIRFIEDENYQGTIFNSHDIDEFIRSIAEQVRQQFPSYEQNPDLEVPHLVPVLFKYLDIKYDRGTLKDKKSTRYYINKTIQYLVEQGYIVKTTDNQYHSTLRFKFHVSKLVSDEKLHELLQLKGDDSNSTNK